VTDPRPQKHRKGRVHRVLRWLTTEKRLNHALILVVVLGLVVAFIAWVVLSWLLGQGWPWTSTTGDTTRLDVTKLALTVVGGAGALVALTVAYRRQKDLEDGRFTERFGAAAAQLAAPTPAERLAGVYAMAGVADRYPAFAQQCIDVLCGYLRIPFDPDPAVGQLATVVRHHRLSADGDRTVDRTYQLLPNDREVRDTIVRVIAAHVHQDREIGWHEHDLDFTGALITTSDFANTRFNGRTRFNRATFTSLARFDRATFSRRASFDEATFTGEAWFGQTTFTGFTEFKGTIFTSHARFAHARFVGQAVFNDARFIHLVSFDAATFSSGGSFDGATFTGELVRPDGTTVVGTATEQPLGPALGFPDPEPDNESED
jgi:hypothetical protein